jgi:hypothetical protein
LAALHREKNKIGMEKIFMDALIYGKAKTNKKKGTLMMKKLVVSLLTVMCLVVAACNSKKEGAGLYNSRGYQGRSQNIFFGNESVTIFPSTGTTAKERLTNVKYRKTDDGYEIFATSTSNNQEYVFLITNDNGKSILLTINSLDIAIYPPETYLLIQ